VGGFVRDALLVERRRISIIAVGADVLEIGPQLADSAAGQIRAVGRNQSHRDGLSCRIGPSIVASFKRKIEDDLKRARFHHQCHGRGFASLISEKQNTVLIDCSAGRLDLDRGNKQDVSATDIPGRPRALIEGTRLAAELDFTIDRQAEAEMEKAAPLIATRPERKVREELLRLLNGLPRRAGFRRHGKWGC